MARESITVTGDVMVMGTEPLTGGFLRSAKLDAELVGQKLEGPGGHE